MPRFRHSEGYRKINKNIAQIFIKINIKYYVWERVNFGMFKTGFSILDSSNLEISKLNSSNRKFQKSEVV